MKLLSTEEIQKEVEYKGYWIMVPACARYIATDNDGRAYAYYDKPDKCSGLWLDTGEDYQQVALFEMMEGEWADSLVELPE